METNSNLTSSSIHDLPKETCMGGSYALYKWEGFWYLQHHLKATMEARSRFQARDDDILLASSMKTGTTWLKALIPCIMNPQSRVVNDDMACEDPDPLIHNHPNVLIPSLELQVFLESSSYDVLSMPSPRLFRTHVPFSSLPESVKSSECKIVYITRNTKDTFVSWWHFANAIRTNEQGSTYAGPLPIAETFEEFSNGVHPFGPFHDHVLEYWNESLQRPGKILFMRYEEMKRDPKGEVKKLALFLERPFENEEEVEKVIWRCSLDRLKSLQVNKVGVDPWIGIPKSAYFRLGVVGDWKRSLTTEMEERLDEITRAKMKGSGLELST